MQEKAQINQYILDITRGGEIAANAVESLYESMGGIMRGVAYGILLNNLLADDAVQESFIKIVKYAEKFRRMDNGYGWILTIVRNTALNKLAMEKLRTATDIDEMYNLSLPQEDLETKLTVQDALRQLDERERIIISLKYFEDKTIRDIAKIMKMPFSTVQNVVTKAEKKLKEILSR